MGSLKRRFDKNLHFLLFFIFPFFLQVSIGFGQNLSNTEAIACESSDPCEVEEDIMRLNLLAHSAPPNYNKHVGSAGIHFPNSPEYSPSTGRTMTPFIVCSAAPSEKIISGKVFNDANNNGTNDSESGIQNVDVKIYNDVNQNSAVDGGDVLLSTEITNVNGEYSYTFTAINKNYQENFSGSVFSGTNNNSGADNWASDFWVTDGANGNKNVDAGSFVDPDNDFGSDAVLQFSRNDAGAYRIVDLSGASAALLSFEYDVESDVDGAGEGFFVQVSTNNGGSYTTIYSYANTDGNSPTPQVSVTNVDLSTFITLPASATTRLRFISNADVTKNEDIWIDNIVLNVTEDASDFVIETDAASYPANYTLSTDNIETAVIATGGTCDENNDFGLYFPDNDGDGIMDSDDLDDDNDGITDLVEAGVTCDETIVLTGGSGGKIYQVNLVSGTTTLFTTSNLVTGNINGLASNPDAGVFYYASGTTVYVYNPTTNTHSVVQDLNGLITGQALESGGAAYYYGNLYIGAEDAPGGGNIDDIYQIPLASDGLSFTGAPVGLGADNGQGGFGDFVIRPGGAEGVIYGSTSISGQLWSLDIATSTYTSINTGGNVYQLAVDFEGQLWAASGTTLRRLDDSGNVFGTSYTLTEASVDLTGPFNCAQPDYSKDSDGDGVADYLDIDADNDGIVDNTEAQATASYIAPSNTDTDNDGLDDAYDTDCTPCGAITGVAIIPVDTDSDGIADYIDTNSDNDGATDAIEGHDTNGDGVVDGSDSPAANTGLSGGSTDADNDGLLDGFDNNTASKDPTNGSLTPESHPKVRPGSTDRDWREILDTDGDGIADTNDLDDDNDGIPDTEEFGSLNYTNGDFANNVTNWTNSGFGIVAGQYIFSDVNCSSNTISQAVVGCTDIQFQSFSFDVGWNNGASSCGGSDVGTGAIRINGVEYLNILTPSGGGSNRDNATGQGGDALVVGLNGAVFEIANPSAQGPQYIDHSTYNNWTFTTITVTLPSIVTNADISIHFDTGHDDMAFDNVQMIYAFCENDTDGDGIADHLDLDSDNDGIPDIVEARGVDTNGDGKVDNFVDTNNNGLSDEYDIDNGGTAISNPDSDGDGIIDSKDLDADNDGIPDVVEAGGTDANGDGIADDFVDTDNDGFNDVVDGDVGNDGTAENSADALVLTGADTDSDGAPNSYPADDTDGDGVLDHLDLDADNDGIADVVEAGGTDANGDGIADDFADTDGDGFNDVVDGDVGNDGTAENSADALVLTGADTDGDGAPNSYANGDTDGDGYLDHLDLDADNDGIADVVEAGGTDANGDGIADNFADADGDGFNDVVDGDVGNDGTAENSADALILTGADTDGDGAPNSYANGDTDGDGRLDHQDLDADNDGIADVVEAGGTDANGDGFADDFVDTDNDGFNDVVDGDVGNDGTAENSADVLVLTGADTDGDGAPNSYPANDTDGDGVLDHLDLDADNDGIADVVEAGGTDANGDGIADDFVDTDNDGFNDVVDGDVGNDGTAENSADALVLTGADTDADGQPNSYPEDDMDGDGLLNHIDLDADNDGILDVFEVGGTDANRDGIADNYVDTDGDGFNDLVDGDVGNDGTAENSANAQILTGSDFDANGTPDTYPNGDSDGDLVMDFIDVDSDNDGIFDIYESQATTGFIALSGIDSDNDGIDNAFDDDDVNFGGAGAAGTIPVNTDSGTGDLVADYLDLDADGDGVPDMQEAWDALDDGDSRPDGLTYSDCLVDSDGDGYVDCFDSDDSNINVWTTNVTPPVDDGTAGSPTSPGVDITASNEPDDVFPNNANGDANAEPDWRDAGNAECASALTFYAITDPGTVYEWDGSVEKHQTTTTSGIIRATTFCEIAGGWYRFYNPLEPSNYLFAMQNGTNTNDLASVVDYIEIEVQSKPIINNGSDHGFTVMARSWKVVTKGALNGTVNIRFYFTPEEFTDFTTYADSMVRSFSGGSLKSEWFKVSSGVDYSNVPNNPNLLNADKYINMDPIVNGQISGQVDTDQAGESKNYVQFDGLTSFSGGTYGGETSGTLPVEWVSFDAKREGSGVVLNWETAIESNNDRFEIERSVDNVNFQTIGQVKGQGNTTEASSYSFIDDKFMSLKSPVLLYRIKQVDFNGAFEYSKTREIQVVQSEDMALLIYPNPADQIINVRYNFSTQTKQEKKLRVYDVLSHELYSKTLASTDDSGEFSIPVQDWRAGYYYISISTKEQVKVYKVLIK